MFYASKALLSVRGIYPKTHKGVVSELGLRFVNEGYIEEIYGKILSKGMQMREMADYDVYYNARKEDAEEIIHDAEEFMGRVSEALKKILESGR